MLIKKHHILIININKFMNNNNLKFANDIDATSKQKILAEFAEKMENQQSIPNEFLEIVNNNFWELLENQNKNDKIKEF